MDLDNDGKIDILSGSYSRKTRDMAGLFFVLRGTDDGFAPAEAVTGTDGKPLVITCDPKKVTDKICTRPTAVDLNGDGHLDIVAGNFSGTFAFFKGTGDGQFSPTSTWLEGPDGPIRVQSHGDPCVIDFDGDGDLDIVSGQAPGGIVWFANTGSKTGPPFRAAQTIAEATKHPSKLTFGDHWTTPAADTRVWVDDLNGDGKFDLIVGDAVRLNFPPEGLDEAESRKRYEAWMRRQDELQKQRQSGELDADGFRKAFGELWKDRSKAIRTEGTGFVWVYYGK